MEKQHFAFYDVHGNALRPWELRAGMTITGTTYNHGDDQVTCTVDASGVFSREGIASALGLPVAGVDAQQAERLRAEVDRAYS